MSPLYSITYEVVKVIIIGGTSSRLHVYVAHKSEINSSIPAVLLKV